MVKPICVIKVDTRKIMGIELYQIQQLLDDKINDYHVLVVPFEQPENEYDESIQVQVFYERDFTEVQYAELKNIILETLSSFDKD